MQRISLGLSTAAGMLLAATAALAAPSQADVTFANQAAQSGLAEVQAGQMATQKATSPQVKQYGQKLVTDHTNANQQLEQIAAQQGLTLPTQPNVSQQSQARALSSLSGNEFDSKFASDEVQDHQQAIAMFRKEAQNGKDPTLKAFAQQTLPVLRQHLQIAQSLQSAQSHP